MKKLASLALAFALCAACAAPVLADETKTTTITTTINPTYTVVIPAATNITFNHTDTNLNGTLHLSAAQLDPDHEVTISATEHELVNQADNTKTIQFTLYEGSNSFTSTSFTDTKKGSPTQRPYRPKGMEHCPRRQVRGLCNLRNQLQ